MTDLYNLFSHPYDPESTTGEDNTKIPAPTAPLFSDSPHQQSSSPARP
ncbi:MAG: hypothetical protein WBB07_11375 [Mycobacterium sp.]